MQLLRYYFTLKHLKLIQIRYQFWYRVRRYWRKMIGFKYPLSINREGLAVKLEPFIKKHTCFDDYQFSFLNQSKTFSEKGIDWNYSEYGKLWTYNLNYFDFLNQEQIKPENGLKLIDDYISNLNQCSTGLEPYPIALRGINWIKFLSEGSLFTLRSLRETAAFAARNIDHINNFLYSQYQILLDNIEYHLLGNHLLEDGFSLLFGAFYFMDKELYKKAHEIIQSELNEQILDDGAHFELSPMYHQIILDRLLDCVNLLQNNKRYERQDKLLILMEQKAQLMLEWINQMTFSNNQIPLLNDAATDIAPDTQKLIDYAYSLNLKLTTQNLKLSSSGYRRFNGKKYEAIIDVGQIGSSYQPGHAHADTFNFVLNVYNQPFIVDMGISTYDKNNRRYLERSTSSHNTVVVDGKNQSDVWGGFRIGKRAKVQIISEEANDILVTHNGYKSYGITHQRSFQFDKESILIIDSLLGEPNSMGTSYLHFHPDVHIVQNQNNLIINNNMCIKIYNPQSINITDYMYPLGYNKYVTAKKCLIKFNSTMSFKILPYED